jgi:hypothetical protein
MSKTNNAPTHGNHGTLANQLRPTVLLPELEVGVASGMRLLAGGI